MLERLPALLLFCAWLPGCSPLAAEDPEPCQVHVNDETGKGLIATLYRIPSGSSKPEWLLVTDGQGAGVLKRPCQPGDRIRIIPRSVSYETTEIECPGKSTTISLGLQNTLVLNTLRYAQSLELKGKPGQASLQYNQALGLLKAEQPDQTGPVEQKLFEQFAAAIASPNGTAKVTTFDAQQKKHVITPEFKDAIKAFQSREGLKVDGVLNYKTLKAAAVMNKK